MAIVFVNMVIVYTTRDSFNMPVASLVAVPSTTSSYNNNRNKPTNHYNTKTKSSPKTTSGIGRTPAPKLATNTVATKAGGAYDPFYPNYKGFGRKASSLHR